MTRVAGGYGRPGGWQLPRSAEILRAYRRSGDSQTYRTDRASACAYRFLPLRDGHATDLQGKRVLQAVEMPTSCGTPGSALAASRCSARSRPTPSPRVGRGRRNGTRLSMALEGQSCAAGLSPSACALLGGFDHAQQQAYSDRHGRRAARAAVAQRRQPSAASVTFLTVADL